MEQMDEYCNIDSVSLNEQNRDGCRPGKLKTDRGMKAEDRNRHKLSAPVAYSLLGLGILLSAAALCVAVILLAQMGEIKRSDADFRVESSQWMSNVTGNVEKATSSLSDVQAEIALLRELTGNIRTLSSSLTELQVGISHLKELHICPAAWVNFKQSCYLFPSSSKTWEEAQKSCMSADAHLVVINNAEEQDFLMKKEQVRRWIGLSDKASEGDWRWVDGTDYKSSAQFWNKGEPNNENGEDCVEMYIGGNWNDLPCNKTLSWICEKPA